MMHPLFQKADQLSHTTIGAAIEVHRVKGPGLIESIYEKCFMRELSLRQVAAVNQRIVKIEYKGLVFEEPLRFDVLVEDCLRGTPDHTVAGRPFGPYMLRVCALLHQSAMKNPTEANEGNEGPRGTPDHTVAGRPFGPYMLRVCA